MYTDLCLADTLIRTNASLKIIFHCKTIPWFVSDTKPSDFEWTLAQLETMGFTDQITQWRAWIKSGIWTVKTDEFWCTPLSFWNLPKHGGFAYKDIQSAGLTIYKGDLNYRKMVFDAEWPTTTPFRVAIGPLHSPDSTPFLMLRTSKSDVVVGLKPGQEEELKSKDPNWMVNGKWGMIQYYEYHE